MAVFVGSIYFNPNDDDDILTVLKYQNKDVVKVVDCKGDISKKEVVDLMRNYTLLEPHGYITFNIVKLKDTVEDVIVSFHKSMLDTKPYCVCRQCISDLFANQMVRNDNQEYFGVSISQDTCPVDVDFNIMLTCNNVIDADIVSYYRTYSLDDILSVIDTKKYDKVLHADFLDHVRYKTKQFGQLFYDSAIQQDTYQGFCKTLKGLLESNNFMYDVYQCMGIIPIHIENISNIANGENDHRLYDPDVEVLSNLLRKNIYDTVCVQYDLDIDLSEVKREYVLIRDEDDNTYMVGYAYKGDYIVPIETVESPDNIMALNDIMTKANKDNMSIRNAYDRIILNTSKYK